MSNELTEWMDRVAGPHFVWYVKRLSGNDTLANGSHQAGPYIPRQFLFSVLPSLDRPESHNPDVRFDLSVDSHSKSNRVRAVWYNNKLHGGTRNEARLTNLGGGSSPLLDPESTGSLTVFAFKLGEEFEAKACRCWVCRGESEEELVEGCVGPVEPGEWRIWTPEESELFGQLGKEGKSRTSCWLEIGEIPQEWLSGFPTGLEIIKKTIDLRPDHGLDPDHRLVRRRDCEFEIFRSVEEAIELPRIRQGFGSIDEFVAQAQTVLQRRKARSGRSLELHAREIFVEEGLEEDADFSHGPESERGKKPDFLFPSEECYKDASFSSERLRMLAVKTTCKDRWRQILNEADRIEKKHLLTLQEGVSETQFSEMKQANVQLVVPAPVICTYPPSVQPQLQSCESFIRDVKMLNV